MRRRDFLGSAAAAGVWLTLSSRVSGSPNEKLNVGVIGVGGRGARNLEGVSGENVVALCDVDEKTLDQALAKHPRAARYVDFRKMLEERKDVDAVVVSTADHVHAVAAVMAMKLGKHVYCEKPLSHSIHEARVMAETAARCKVVTQMGNQGHSSDGRRSIVELLRSGAIGAVTEVHAWVQNPTWPQGILRPAETHPVPSHLRWDLWLGPAPERPYHSRAYHPFNWRGWHDFGSGALGDMGCHVLDSAFWALELGAPAVVEVEGDPRVPESGPRWEVVRFRFPARGSRPPVSLTWYDGGKLPPEELAEGVALPKGRGAIYVGEKGKLVVLDDDRAKYRLFPESKFADFQPPPKTLPRPAGHHAEWIEACKSGGTPGSSFAYGGPLTELVLLGTVAWRAGKRLEWDGPAMKAVNCPEASAFVRREYRPGWTL
jgi:predicted dehydrogenase